MTTPEGSRTKQELSKEILRTANDLFTEHGVESVSMHQIAKSVGIGQGTLYRRYSNKGDLCMDVMRENFDRFLDEIGLFLEQHAELPVQERLCGVMRRIIDFIDQKSKWLGVVHAHTKLEDDKNDFFQSPPYLYLHSALSGLIREGTEQGAMLPVDPVYTAHSFISAHSPHAYQHLRFGLGYSCEEIQDRFCAAFIDPLFR